MTLPKRKYCGQVKPGAVIPPARILEQLITGRMMLDDLNFPELNSVEIKKAWGKYRCYVMGLLGEIVTGIWSHPIAIPWGSRPWAWWEFDSPGPRRLLSGDPSDAMLEHGYSNGKPRVFKSLAVFNQMQYESQFEFLQRLDLLMEGEAEKIRPSTTYRQVLLKP